MAKKTVKKKTTNYKSDKEVQQNEFVKILYDLISANHYKYKKVNRENVIKYYTAQCKKLRKEMDKRKYNAAISLVEMPNRGLVQVIVAWHSGEGINYFVHTNNYIAGEIGPDCRKLGEF
jgi:vancomycin resistance protein YoaR